jgi:hypothetical protein
LAEEFPAQSAFRQDLAASQRHLGLLLEELGRPGEAEKAYRVALAHHQALAWFDKALATLG